MSDCWIIWNSISLVFKGTQYCSPYSGYISALFLDWKMQYLLSKLLKTHFRLSDPLISIINLVSLQTKHMSHSLSIFSMAMSNCSICLVLSKQDLSNF